MTDAAIPYDHNACSGQYIPYSLAVSLSTLDRDALQVRNNNTLIFV